MGRAPWIAGASAVQRSAAVKLARAVVDETTGYATGAGEAGLHSGGADEGHLGTVQGGTGVVGQGEGDFGVGGAVRCCGERGARSAGAVFG
ncbi:hypothetical protein CANINC_002468 [Pichia inconspicua]|uniref:Uncharacterized protein n=1 Tax=Pichia inconspicua TaxID=52247 RepID=A0A4T0X1K1_9ASCO|nr:hypothetical protein CANINC_002468 [[Candida] inconspicua]